MLDQMISARTGLLLQSPFFGALALGLRLQEDPTCDTAWVDGRTLGFNPVFVAGLTHDQRIALIGHEVMHCSNGHPWRRDGREMRKFNVACDKAINNLLRDAERYNDQGKVVGRSFTLPPDVLYAEGPEIGQSAEWIYARLPDEQEGDGKGKGNGKGNGKGGDPLGEVRDAPTPGDGDPEEGEVPTEADWKQKTIQSALAAKAMGHLPGSMERLVKELAQPKVDWRSALRRFVQERAKADYTWSKPNSRYVSLGMYLPALESHALGELAIAVDTSGSIDNVALAAAKAEVVSVIDECQPLAVNIYYADARVAQVDRFERGDELVWRPKGGGGTDFRPVFKAVEEGETTPVCLIYITDTLGFFPESSNIPVLWVTDNRHARVPFGELVQMC